jgi:hypothetical protein
VSSLVTRMLPFEEAVAVMHGGIAPACALAAYRNSADRRARLIEDVLNIGELLKVRLDGTNKVDMVSD